MLSNYIKLFDISCGIPCISYSGVGMKCVVTGVAGFIGSHLGEALVAEDHDVVGIDCFTDYYPKAIKRKNLATLLESNNFEFSEKDIAKDSLEKELSGAEAVFHLAAQPGVRKSWGSDFENYVRNNITATQKLLEACSSENSVKKFVFASSSSVYGNVRAPFKEDQSLAPVSPYGVSKLCCENLCRAYSGRFDISVLRFFTVYGPRQRPDMAFNQFISSAIRDEQLVIYGDGSQVRDFTYVSDVVDAVIKSSAVASESGFEIFNVGNSSAVKLSDALSLLEELAGRKLKMRFAGGVKGDMAVTIADISKARKLLGYSPKTSLGEGLKKEFEWLKSAGNA